jgi:hypothetical protein
MTTLRVDLAKHELSAIARWAEQTPWIFEISPIRQPSQGHSAPRQRY